MEIVPRSQREDYLILSSPLLILFPAMMFALGQKKAAFVIFLSFLFFLRSPDRKLLSKNATQVYSPADGVVERIDIFEKYIRVSIYLNIFDCHIQYIPIDGSIVEQKYIKGRFHPAYQLVKSDYNERLETHMKTTNGEDIFVVQIAGQLARRINSFVTPDDKVNTGEKLGVIKFGSRVDVYLPISANVKVRVSDRVSGATDVIATI